MITCPKCGRLAPRLIRWHGAGLPETVECPKDAYPAQRYLGGWAQTMPAEDQAWYDAQPHVPQQDTVCGSCGAPDLGPGGVLCVACRVRLGGQISVIPSDSSAGDAAILDRFA
jgi:hypothetical protein